MIFKKTLIASAIAVSFSVSMSAQAERGRDGEVRLIYWQAPSTMNTYLSGGTKEQEAASIVWEPLVRYDTKGVMVPYLVEEVPTIENGGVSEDLMSITWKLKKDILWSDGTPLTAEDVVFTAEYCMHPEGGCSSLKNFAGIESIEALDTHTVKITFDQATPFPYTAFVGPEAPVLQKAQFENCLGARAPECTEANFYPIGTGPFVVTDFRPNDVITFKANENFRDPNKPAFATMTFKGGGDAAAAGRSVLSTGEYDYAWNLQVSPEVIAQLERGGKGEALSAFGTLVERIQINHTNPDPALGPDERSIIGPHPSLTDPVVYQALSLAIDRPLLVEIGYGKAGKVTCNLVPAPDFNNSTTFSCDQQDIAGANKLLDEAGWVKGGDGIRAKDGVKLDYVFQTSTNAVRQDFQALLKQWWSEIGVNVELRNIDSSVFFGGDPGSPDTFQKFYADLQMYANNFAGTDAQAYLGEMTCDKIPSPATQWQGTNISRYCNPEYDALHAKLAATAGLEARSEIIKELNDMLVREGNLIPLVHRGRISARSNTLGGVELNTWDSELWNIADWYRISN